VILAEQPYWPSVKIARPAGESGRCVSLASKERAKIAEKNYSGTGVKVDEDRISWSLRPLSPLGNSGHILELLKN